MTKSLSDRTKIQQTVIGWRERVALPQLGIERITAKTDTGAFSSSIHAFDIEPSERGGESWVTFSVLPSRRNPDEIIRCEAKVSDRRRVKSSDGSSYFIRTELVISGTAFAIEISLANRASMGYRMLLGRTAIRGHFIVDPAGSYLTSKPPRAL
jgi:hypothetical protein